MKHRYSSLWLFPGGIKILLINLTISLLITAILCEWKGDRWEERVRENYYVVIVKEPIPSGHKTYIDRNGIPFVHYFEQNGIEPGRQYNPTVVSVYALHYYDAYQSTHDPALHEKFFNCIGWLGKNMRSKNGIGIFEMEWQQPFYPSIGVPWRSAMSSGLAIRAFLDAHAINPSGKYLELSTALLRGFYTTVEDGGFTFRDSSGWWYEQYACNHAETPGVLNGHIYSLLAAHTFWLATKSDSANFIFQMGLKSLKNKLPLYDAGDGWSFYDAFGKKADKKYQKIIVLLMKKLWNVTGDTIFYQYYNKWRAPLDKPYWMRIIIEKNRSGMILFSLLAAAVMVINQMVMIFIKQQPVRN